MLDIQSGVGETSGAEFSGELTYTGAKPADDLALTATLVSAQQTVGTQVSVDGAGAVTVNYPTTAYCTSVNDAVQQYSNLTGTSTFGAKSFTLTQQTAFLNFVICFPDGTATSTELSAVVSNNSSAVCTANVTTTTESDMVVAKFVLPVAKGTVLSGATVKMGDKAALTITNATLDGKVYNVKKTTPGHELSASALGEIVGTDGKAYAVAFKDILPTGVTAAGVVAFRSGSNGLVIAGFRFSVLLICNPAVMSMRTCSPIRAF